jgi:hypothetical protein
MNNKGDTMSLVAVYSDEAIAEVTDYLGSKKAYVGTDGKFKATTAVDTVELVLHNMTSD